MEDAKPAVKRQFDDDDAELRNIDEGGDAASDEEEDDVPDETMAVGPTSDTWLVKVPRSLMEKWAKVDKDGVPLASMRVMDQQQNGNYVIELSLPENPGYDTKGESSHYKLELPNNPINQYAFSDIPKQLPDGQPPHKKARTTALVGRIAHQGNMIPNYDETYRLKVKERRIQKEKPKRTTILIDSRPNKGGIQAGGLAFVDNDNSLQAGKANLKMLASGAGKPNVGFALSDQKKVGQSTSTGKKGVDKAYRFSREDVLDSLFNLFKEFEYWSLKDLRQRTQQPEQYLKSILRDVALSPKSGPNAHMWHLKPFFAEKAGGASAPGATGSGTQSPSGSQVKMEGGQVKLEGDDDEDDDNENDNDDDMEEVTGGSGEDNDGSDEEGDLEEVH